MADYRVVTKLEEISRMANSLLEKYKSDAISDTALSKELDNIIREVTSARNAKAIPLLTPIEDITKFYQ